MFNTILLDKSIDDRLRGYPTWLSSRNLANETTDEAVEALIHATTSRYDLPQRYYRLKARLLGLDRLEHFDRFAPISSDAGRVPWDEARAVVVDAYSDFSEETGSIIARFFDDSWIDGPVRPDKRTGAFCATTIPGRAPVRADELHGRPPLGPDARTRARSWAPRRPRAAARATSTRRPR